MAFDSRLLTTCSRRNLSHCPTMFSSATMESDERLRMRSRSSRLATFLTTSPRLTVFVPKLQPPLADPADIQELVDELGEAPVLALDDRQDVRQRLRPNLPLSDRLGREVNRRDRTAKLVRRHREKFVAGAQRLLSSSVQPRVVQRESGAAGELLRHLDVAGLISAVRGGAERDCALQAAFHEQGNAEVGDRSHLVDQRLPARTLGCSSGEIGVLASLEIATSRRGPVAPNTSMAQPSPM